MSALIDAANGDSFDMAEAIREIARRLLELEHEVAQLAPPPPTQAPEEKPARKKI